MKLEIYGQYPDFRIKTLDVLWLHWHIDNRGQRFGQYVMKMLWPAESNPELFDEKDDIKAWKIVYDILYPIAVKQLKDDYEAAFPDTSDCDEKD